MRSDLLAGWLKHCNLSLLPYLGPFNSKAVVAVAEIAVPSRVAISSVPWFKVLQPCTNTNVFLPKLGISNLPKSVCAFISDQGIGIGRVCNGYRITHNFVVLRLFQTIKLNHINVNIHKLYVKGIDAWSSMIENSQHPINLQCSEQPRRHTIVALVRQFFILGAPVRAPGAAGARVRGCAYVWPSKAKTPLLHRNKRVIDVN